MPPWLWGNGDVNWCANHGVIVGGRPHARIGIAPARRAGGGLLPVRARVGRGDADKARDHRLSRLILERRVVGQLRAE